MGFSSSRLPSTASVTICMLLLLQLKLHDIRTADEGEYKCEITFLDITKNCPVVQLVKLNTLGERALLN